MDKFEHLKKYVADLVLEYQNKIEKIKQEIENTDDMWESYFLDEELKNWSDKLCYAKRKEQYLIDNETKVREMLENFYDDGLTFVSFVYENIHRVPHTPYNTYWAGFKYQVRQRHFRTFEEAKEYSISLGEKEDWLPYAYSYI